MSKMTFRTIPVLLLACLALAAPARADDRDHDRARIAREAGEVVPLERLLAEVARTEPGKVIDVDLERGHGRYVYEVKLLAPDGRRRKILYDARTLERVER